jgi:hypothetical protein
VGKHTGKKVTVEEKQNDAVLWGFFFYSIFYFKKGILVTLKPKTTSFWVFHPFSRFHLMEGAIL